MLTDGLRAAVRADGRTLGAIGRAAGIDVPRLCRFAAGTRGLSLAAADRLALALGLRLVGGARPQDAPGTTAGAEVVRSTVPAPPTPPRARQAPARPLVADRQGGEGPTRAPKSSISNAPALAEGRYEGTTRDLRTGRPRTATAEAPDEATARDMLAAKLDVPGRAVTIRRLG